MAQAENVSFGRVLSVVIPTAANGQMVDGVALGSFHHLAIHMPASWTTGNLTLLASSSLEGTYNDVYDDAGSEVTIVAAASRCIVVDLLALAMGPLRFIKLRSGTSGTPVQQAGARTLILSMKD
jgi:predicted RecA/RadA family phage recombinase